jgi:hypothetical protein
MQYKDLLRGTVLLIGVEATGLAVVAALTINAAADDVLAILTLVWWAAGFSLGIHYGGPERAADALRDPLSRARTSTTLPAEPSMRTALARLWPIALFAIVAGALGVIWPQVPAIATGWALFVALAWRKREAAVTAIEERDGVCFYVEQGSAFEPVKLIRTPGLRRDRPPSAHPPPPTA